jgi:plastocyanin
MIKFATALVVIAAIVATAGGAVAQTDAPIGISLTDYAFSPSTLDLKSGIVYHLHFVNSGSKAHNFSAPEFFAASQIAPEDQAKMKKGLVDLESGQSIDITVTPGQPGSFAFECTHFMHKMMGMHGTITVQ